MGYQLQVPMDAVIFDCDGTLSTIEGIDELARQNGAGSQVEAMTAEAMGKTGINQAIYQKRLELVRPTKAQLDALGLAYYDHRIPDAVQVINILNRLNKIVYMVSAGLYPAVAKYGELLKIPRDNIFAVDVQFDADGNYRDFDRASPLVDRQGKREIVKQIQKKHQRIVYVGDGLNDLAVYDLVTRFIGFGGQFYRENIAEKCEFYIKTLSVAPVLPLGLTESEAGQLLLEEKKYYQDGLSAINS